MRVLLVNGGGRPDGFTSYLCGLVSGILESRGFDVSVLELTEQDIGFCTGCGICKKTGRCYQEDDMDILMDMFMSSEMVVFATPVRFSGLSSILKRYMERFQPCWFRRNETEYGCMTAIICGGSERPDFKSVSHELKAFSITMGRRWLSPLEISGTDDPDPETYAKKCIEWINELQI